MSVEKKMDGTIVYRDENGELHREDGPAVIGVGGHEAWMRHGYRHREDGPAIVDPREGYREWWVDGELHREDGPAIEYDDGYKEYWHHGVEIPEDRLGKGPLPDDGVLVFHEEIV